MFCADKDRERCAFFETYRGGTIDDAGFSYQDHDTLYLSAGIRILDIRSDRLAVPPEEIALN